MFSFDEKTQVQALDRTQPSLPMKRGRGESMTHDYKRMGTTDLFAALNVATARSSMTPSPATAPPKSSRSSSTSIFTCPAISRSTSCWTTFRPQGTRDQKWLTHPRSGSDGTCISRRHRRRGSTSSRAGSTSSPNDGLRRGTFTSVDVLIEAIEMWAEHWNDNPSRSSGRKPPTTSSPRSAADGPHSPKPNPRRTTRRANWKLPVAHAKQED